MSEVKLITDCSKLTLDKFLDCLFDKDYSVLIVQGEPSQEELLFAWQRIFAQYNAMVATEENNRHIEKTKEANILVGKISLVAGIIHHLQIIYEKELVDILQELGLKPNIKEDDSFDVRISKLATVESRAKKWVTKLDILTKELEKEQTNEEGIIATRDTFSQGLERYNRYAKTQYLPWTITVSIYCQGIKHMIEAAKKLELKKAQGK